MVRENNVIEHLYDYGVVCSYDEVKRFKTSAAVAANEMTKGSVLRPHEYGLVQVVADNFDATIYSQNGLKHAHAYENIMVLAAPRINICNSSTVTYGLCMVYVINVYNIVHMLYLCTIYFYQQQVKFNDKFCVLPSKLLNVSYSSYLDINFSIQIHLSIWMEKRRDEQNSHSDHVSTKHHCCTSRGSEDDILQMLIRKTVFEAQLYLFRSSTFLH